MPVEKQQIKTENMTKNIQGGNMGGFSVSKDAEDNLKALQ
jgi:hypothetical protein